MHAHATCAWGHGKCTPAPQSAGQPHIFSCRSVACNTAVVARGSDYLPYTLSGHAKNQRFYPFGLPPSHAYMSCFHASCGLPFKITQYRQYACKGPHATMRFANFRPPCDLQIYSMPFRALAQVCPSGLQCKSSGSHIRLPCYVSSLVCRSSVGRSVAVLHPHRGSYCHMFWCVGACTKIQLLASQLDASYLQVMNTLFG